MCRPARLALLAACAATVAPACPAQEGADAAFKLEITGLERADAAPAAPGYRFPYRVRVRNAGDAALPDGLRVSVQATLTENPDGSGRSSPAGGGIESAADGLEPGETAVIDRRTSRPMPRFNPDPGPFAGLRVTTRLKDSNLRFLPGSEVAAVIPLAPPADPPAPGAPAGEPPAAEPAAETPRWEIVALELLEPTAETPAGRIPYRVRARNTGESPLQGFRGVVSNAWLTENADGTGRRYAVDSDYDRIPPRLPPDVAVVFGGFAALERAGGRPVAGLRVEMHLSEDRQVRAPGTQVGAAVPLDAARVAPGPRLTISDLRLTARTDDAVTYRATVKNVGDGPPSPTDRVIVQAHLAPDAGGGPGTEVAESERVRDLRGLTPGGQVEIQGTATTAPAGEDGFLLVKVGRPSGLAGWDDADAVPLNAPLAADPAGAANPGAANPAAAKPAGGARRGDQPGGWGNIMGFVCIGAVFLLIASAFLFMIYAAVTSAMRSRKRGSGRFLSADDGDFDDWEEATRDLGFPPLKTTPSAARLALQADDYERPAGRGAGGGTWTLCDTETTRTHRSGSGDNRSSHTVVTRNTALVFAAAGGVRFPPFASMERRRFPKTGRIGRTLFRWMGVEWISVPEDPEFEAAVQVWSNAPEAARPLLTPKVRAALTENKDLTVSTSGRAVTVRYAAQRRGPARSLIQFGSHRTRASTGWIRAEDRPAFLKAAGPVVQAIRQAEKATRAGRPDFVDAEERASALASSPTRGTRPKAEIDAFCAQDAPRALPRAIRKASLRSMSTVLRIVGWFVLLLAGGLTALLVTVAREGDVSWFAPLFPGSAAALAGGLLAWSTWRRLREVGLMKHGMVVPAKVVSVKATGTSMQSGGASHTQFRITFAYEVRRERHEGRVKEYGRQAELAAELQESGGKTRLLVDRDQPSRLFWIDGLSRPAPPPAEV